MKVKRIYDGDATINDWWNKNAVAFSTSSWLRIYDQRLIRFGIFSEKENCVGGFVAYEGGKSWAKTLITPPYAPNIGLFFISSKHNPSQELSARKQVASAIAEFLPSSPYKWYKLDFPPDWRDVQPMVWEGFEVSPRFTYRIPLAEKGKHWMDDTDPKLRNM
ncbi:MAG: hypothetical protein IT223_04100, partial [Crocinitomicaceae bacterium]|nr:hypothetical protein [Crocinitomicaceae bacterium]